MNGVFDIAGPGQSAFYKEQFDTYVSLGLEKAEYFALLDRPLYDDMFFDELGPDCAFKLSGRGGYTYESMGRLIADKLDNVANNCKLTAQECCALASVVKKNGLYFGSDISAWDEYRRSKAVSFRLAGLEALDSRFSEKVRKYFYRFPSPISLTS